MLQALIGPVTGLLDKFIPDAGEKARLAHEIATMAEKQAHELALAQIEVNVKAPRHIFIGAVVNNKCRFLGG